MFDLNSVRNLRKSVNALDSRLRRLDRPVLYWITTGLLILTIAGTILDVVGIRLHWAISYATKDSKVERSLTTRSVAYAYADANLVAPDLKDKLPPGVHFDGTLPVTVDVDRSTTAGKVLSRLSSVPLDLLVLVVVWLIRQMVLSAVGTPGSPGNPFVRANLRRLRIIAAILIMLPLVDTWSSIAEWELVSRSLTPDISFFSWDASSMFVEMGMGMLLFLLSEVFAAGIRLREDVEGLV